MKNEKQKESYRTCISLGVEEIPNYIEVLENIYLKTQRVRDRGKHKYLVHVAPIAGGGFGWRVEQIPLQGWNVEKLSKFSSESERRLLQLMHDFGDLEEEE